MWKIYLLWHKMDVLTLHLYLLQYLLCYAPAFVTASNAACFGLLVPLLSLHNAQINAKWLLLVSGPPYSNSNAGIDTGRENVNL